MAENKKIIDEAEESLKLMDKTYGGYKKSLSPQEVAQLREKMHSDDKRDSERAKNQLIRHGYSTICSYAKKLVKDCSKSEEYDKRMEAVLLYLRAVEKYDDSKGVKLTTFFLSGAKNKVNDIKTADEDFSMSPKDRRALATLNKIREEYRAKYGRLPDNETEIHIYVQEKIEKKAAQGEVTARFIRETENEARSAIKNSTISNQAVSLEQRIDMENQDTELGDIVASAETE